MKDINKFGWIGILISIMSLIVSMFLDKWLGIIVWIIGLTIFFFSDIKGERKK